MQVETLPNKQEAQTNRSVIHSFKNVSPLVFKFRNLVLYKVITTIEEVDSFKDKYSDQADAFDDTLSDLLDAGIISVKNDEIVVHTVDVTAGNSMEDFLKYIPEVAKQLSKNALNSRASGDFNSFLDFSSIIVFPDDPEVLTKASAIFATCYKQLLQLGEIQTEKTKNTKVRAVSFTGGVLGGAND